MELRVRSAVLYRDAAQDGPTGASGFDLSLQGHHIHHRSTRDACGSTTVGRRTEISDLDEWGERSPLTQIVAIGAGIDAQELDEKFAACIARL